MSSRLMNHERALREEINQQIEDNKRMAYSEFDDEPLDAYDG